MEENGEERNGKTPNEWISPNGHALTFDAQWTE